MPAPGVAPNSPAVARSAWGILGFLTLLNVLNFVDRLLIASLLLARCRPIASEE